MDRLVQASVYAAHMYRQRALNLQGDSEPFINFALNIVNLLMHRGGVENITWLAASLLSHIEPAQFCGEELRQTFGADVEGLAFRVMVARHCPDIYGMLGNDVRTLLLAECAVGVTYIKAMSWSVETRLVWLARRCRDVAALGNVNDGLWTAYHEGVKACQIKLE